MKTVLPSIKSRETRHISIVLATHNGEQFLTEQLDSLIAQTYPILEIIIVDDASTDHTIEILHTYANKYSHIKLFFNKGTIGHIRNFEKGMRLSKGEYIALCDQDDIWLPTKVEKLMCIIGDSYMAYCDSELIDEKGNSLGKKLSDIKNLRSYDDCLAYSIGNSVSGHSSIFSRHLLDIALPMIDEAVHDWFLAFHGAQRKPIQYTSEALVLYRQHSRNCIGAIKEKRRKRKKIINEVKVREIRTRMSEFYKKCAVENEEEKEVLKRLAESYQNFSFVNNYRRMMIFFEYRNRLLAIKKRSQLRKWLFCLKMFFKVI